MWIDLIEQWLTGEGRESPLGPKHHDLPLHPRPGHPLIQRRVSWAPGGLVQQLIDGLQSIRGVTVQGISSAEAQMRRVPTVSFTHDKIAPAVIAEALAQRNIFVWNGHNYGLEPAKALGLLKSGGVVRIGAVHYNSTGEIDETLNALEEIL